MKKRIESAPQLRLRLQEFTFRRPRRTWPPSGVLASQPSDFARFPVRTQTGSGPGWNSTTSWIRRQRLN